jgi:hypothetical protein
MVILTIFLSPCLLVSISRISEFKMASMRLLYDFSYKPYGDRNIYFSFIKTTGVTEG